MRISYPNTVVEEESNSAQHLANFIGQRTTAVISKPSLICTYLFEKLQTKFYEELPAAYEVFRLKEESTMYYSLARVISLPGYNNEANLFIA